MTFDPKVRADLLPITRAYLRDWLAWVERSAPDEEPYFRGLGLCSNIEDFPTGDYSTLRQDLDKAFGGEATPFGQRAYLMSGEARRQHEDPNRLAWVRLNAPEDAP